MKQQQPAHEVRLGAHRRLTGATARDGGGLDRALGPEMLESRHLLAGAPTLLWDVNATGSSNPTEFVAVGNAVYFAADNGTLGRELWKSDGTSSGTVLVKDINPSGSSSPTSLVNVNGTLYFQANDGVNGSELWRSDGTSAGTVLVKDINPLGGSSAPTSLANINGTLYFAANDGSTGSELWKSNGTPEGTVLVRDINAGAGSSTTAYMTEMNGTVYFRADDGIHGKELWKSNGSEAGTLLVKDIVTGSGSSYPGYFRSLANVNGRLLFSASTPAAGFELWKSDGSDTGTVLLKDINPGSAGSFPFVTTRVNGIYYFSANNGTQGFELWRSDGSDAGTYLVKDIFYSGSNSSNPDSLTNVNGTLFFSATSGGAGKELWKSDGTTGGTVLVRDVVSGNGSSDPRNLTNVAGVLYYSCVWGTAGRELAKSDGSSAGTTMIGNLNPTGDSAPGDMMSVNGNLFFSLDNGSQGREPWIIPAASAVAATNLFYNQSKYDGNNAWINAADDGAIAIDKTAYLPGTGAASFANASSFSRGINGIMVDLAGPHGPITAGDFTFRVGNNNTPSQWATAPAPISVVTRAGAGVNGSDRIVLVWNDNDVQRTWLEVIVNAGLNTGLAAPYAFFYASALGDSGEGDASGLVTNSADELGARNNPAPLNMNIPVTNWYDYNRDGKVDVNDQLLARNNSNSVATAPKLLYLAAGSAAPQTEGALDGDAGPLTAAVSLTTASPATATASTPVATTSMAVALDLASTRQVDSRLSRAIQAAGSAARSIVGGGTAVASLADEPVTADLVDEDLLSLLVHARRQR